MPHRDEIVMASAPPRLLTRPISAWEMRLIHDMSPHGTTSWGRATGLIALLVVIPAGCDTQAKRLQPSAVHDTLLLVLVDETEDESAQDESARNESAPRATSEPTPLRHAPSEPNRTATPVEPFDPRITALPTERPDGPRDAEAEHSPRLAYDRVDDWGDFWDEVEEAEAVRSEPSAPTTAEPTTADPAASTEATSTPAPTSTTSAPAASVAAREPRPSPEPPAVTESPRTPVSAEADTDVQRRVARLEAETERLRERVARNAEAAADSRAAAREDELLTLWSAIMTRRLQLLQLGLLANQGAAASSGATSSGGPSTDPFGGLPRPAPASQPFGGTSGAPAIQPFGGVEGSPKRQPFGGVEGSPQQQPFGGTQ